MDLKVRVLLQRIIAIAKLVKLIEPATVISNLRYLAAIVLISSTGILTTRWIANDMLATARVEMPEARELSRAELVNRANQASYVSIPGHDENSVVALNEPEVLAATLASQIDSAEQHDAPPQPAAHQVFVKSIGKKQMASRLRDGQPYAVAANKSAADLTNGASRKLRKAKPDAAGSVIVATVIDGKKLKPTVPPVTVEVAMVPLPIAKPKAAATPAGAEIASVAQPKAGQPIPSATTLKAALNLDKPDVSEPPRRKLARRSPNAGELIRMQLQNLI